jgi:integrase
MSAPMIRTRHPGIFERGSRFVVVFYVDGRQRKESARTITAALKLQRARRTDADRGELAERSTITLHAYLLDWIDRYQGTGRRGLREETRNEYRGLLTKYALRYFPASLRLTALAPSKVAAFVAWLCDPAEQGKQLADQTVRNAVTPLRAALATARREGLIRHNPVTDVSLPHRARIEEDDEAPRPFPDGTMELVVELVHPDHRVMFELLAQTGVRRSELLAIEVRHLHLTGDRPHVKIRQRVRRLRGQGLVIGPLKSRYAKRDVPIPIWLADRLRSHIGTHGTRDLQLSSNSERLVFTSTTGTMLDPDNLAERVLAPACEEAGVEWAGFHTFRHTVASRLFAEGRNAVQVQRWLGHHKPSFTIDTYVHLLPGDVVEPLGGNVSGNPTTRRPARRIQAVVATLDEGGLRWAGRRGGRRI